MRWIALALIAIPLAVAAQDSDTKQRLTNECARGFAQSCKALRSLGGGGSEEEKERLAAECSRGFTKSCSALKALNNEGKPTVCTTSGTARAGTYDGTTICR